MEIVAADPAITIRAVGASHEIAEDGGTQAVTLRAETIDGAPRPVKGTAIDWRTTADSATGGGTDFTNASGIVDFGKDDFTQMGTKWVVEQQVEVAMVDDDATEGTERLFVTLVRKPLTNRLIKLANTDGTLCKDNAAGVNCGAEIRILDDDSANTPPTASDGAVMTSINTAYVFAADDFNFADANAGDTLEKVKIITLPGAGTLDLDGTAVTANQEVTKSAIDDGDLTFTPVTGASGSPYTTFTFKVNDGEAESAAAYTMTVNVTATDDTPPELDGALDLIADGNTVVLTFDEQLDSGSRPAPDAFTVLADGSAVTVTAVLVSGREVRLTLASSVAGANAVTVAYEPPAANPLQNADNTAVRAFGAQPVQVVRREVALGAETLSVPEGDSADYTMTLTLAPTGPVTVTPRVLDNADVTVSGALTFTASNWNQPQTVTVTAAHDADDLDDTATVEHTVSGAEYAGVTAGSVQVAVRDDERVVSYGPMRPEFRSLAAQYGGTNGNTPLWRLALPTEHYGPGDKFHLAVLFWVGTTNRPVQATPGSLANPALLLGPDKALRVTGAGVRFIDVPGDPPKYIRMELTPTGAGDVTVTVEPLPCDVPGAICLQPDRGLSERVRVNVTGVGVAPPAPANVVAAEVSGDGDGEPDLKVSFDPEPSATSWRMQWQRAGRNWANAEEYGLPLVARDHERGAARHVINDLFSGQAYDVRVRWENPVGAGPWTTLTDVRMSGAFRNEGAPNLERIEWAGNKVWMYFDRDLDRAAAIGRRDQFAVEYSVSAPVTGYWHRAEVVGARVVQLTLSRVYRNPDRNLFDWTTYAGPGPGETVWVSYRPQRIRSVGEGNLLSRSAPGFERVEANYVGVDPKLSVSDAQGAESVHEAIRFAVVLEPATAQTDTTQTDTAPAFRVWFEAVPGGHDGTSAITFKVKFNKKPADYSYVTMRDSTLKISQGGQRLTASRARRLNAPHNDQWEVTITPVSTADLTVSVGPAASCSATGAVCAADAEQLSNTVSATIQGPPGLSVADAQVQEAAQATVDFTVTLSRAAAETVTLEYATSDGTAVAGEDYTAAAGTLSFSPGQTTQTVSVAVLDDPHDEGSETFTLALSNPSGNHAWLSAARATGTISNSDPLPKGWLARFGRTSATQVLGLLDARFDEARAPASRTDPFAIPAPSAGRTAASPHALNGGAVDPAAGSAAPDADPFDALSSRYTLDDTAWGIADLNSDPAALHADPSAGPDPAAVGAGGTATLLERLAWKLLTQDNWSVDRRQFLSRSSFDLSLSALGRETDDEQAAMPAGAGHWSLWGRGALTRFAGRERGLSLDGDVLTGLLTPYGGVEMAADRRTLRLGWRFELGRLLSLSLAGERHEGLHVRPEHALMLQTTLPW